jgi:hypothetical protein
MKHDGKIPWDNDILTNLAGEGSMFSLIRKVGQESRVIMNGEGRVYKKPLNDGNSFKMWIY